MGTKFQQHPYQWLVFLPQRGPWQVFLGNRPFLQRKMSIHKALKNPNHMQWECVSWTTRWHINTMKPLTFFFFQIAAKNIDLLWFIILWYKQKKLNPVWHQLLNSNFPAWRMVQPDVSKKATHIWIFLCGVFF